MYAPSWRGWTQAARAAGPEVAELEGSTAAARLATAVATAARAHRGLRRARAQLQVDLAAVLGGLRPAVMLDYAVVPADAVAALVSELAEPGGAACAKCGAAFQERSSGCLELGKKLLRFLGTRMPCCASIFLFVMKSCYRSRSTYECMSYIG